MKRKLPRPGGPRSEVSFLLSMAMLLLVVLSSFTLFSYHATLELLVEERRAEAAAIARRLAVAMAQQGFPSADNLRSQAPNVHGVMVLDEGGRSVLAGGELDVDPNEIISGEARFVLAGRNYRMRVDLVAGLLLSRQRSLDLMTPFILALDAAILLLVILSLRRLLIPIDALVKKARQFADPEQAVPVEANEVSFLASTFDRAIGEIANLTEAYRRSREEGLAQSLTQLGEITAGVAHEMRNSIATLKGYIALIERSRDGGRPDENLVELRRESDHLHRVLEDFLSFARPGSVRLTPVDLRQVLSRALEDPALGRHPYRLTVADGDWEVAGDAHMLERALRNVLSNAVGAQERAGEALHPLEVELRRSLESFEIRVRDHGAGVPPELLPRLFEPFAVGHPKGVGLGLALTRRILELHGGAIELEPAAGGGTLARILLPLRPNSGETATDGST